MATAEQIPGSILSTIVEHEKSLLAQLEDAREQARRIVEDARAEAQQHLQSETAKVTDEVAAMRRGAEEKRLATFEKTVSDADAALGGTRDAAAARVDEVADKVLALFVPNSSGGSKS